MNNKSAAHKCKVGVPSIFKQPHQTNTSFTCNIVVCGLHLIYPTPNHQPETKLARAHSSSISKSTPRKRDVELSKETVNKKTKENLLCFVSAIYFDCD